MPIDTDSRHRIPAKELDREIIAPVLRDLQTVHHLQGAFIPGSPALLLVRAPHPDATLKQLSYHLCQGFFGASATLVATFADGNANIVCVPAGVEGFQTLAAEHLHIAIVLGNRILDVWRVGKAPFAQVCKDADEYQPVMSDNGAHYWEVLSTFVTETILQLSAKDRLSVGWVNRYRDEMDRLSESLADLRSLQVANPSTDANSFVGLLHQKDFNLTRLIQYIESEIGCDFTKLCDLWNGWNFAGADDFPVEMWKSYQYSPKPTDYGKRLPWLSSTSWRMESSPIEVAGFPADFCPEDYWRRISLGGVDLGTYITGRDIYVSVDVMENGWDGFAGADNVKAANDCMGNLYAEAVANKRGTIPPRACVELNVGPFTHIELTEKASSVVAVFRTAADEFYDVAVSPTDARSSFNLPKSMPAVRRQAITAGVNLLIAAVVRDFSVIEEREAVFQRRPMGSQNTRQGSLADKPRIVYLPKIKYQERPEVQRCATDLGHAERRLHSVVPHLRRLADGRQASDQQKMLAKLYGFHFDEGYTFVGPHQRGREKREVIYRSRSALKSLYTIEAKKAVQGKPDHWFQFERDVHSLMLAMGFAVEHVAASRHGDNGIDIYATKGRDLDQINWVIQCKCWHPKRKISPNVIRELVGVLAGYPHGTRGMVVTTCSFSSGAIEAAAAANVRLIDGAEFMELMKSAREQETPARRSGLGD